MFGASILSAPENKGATQLWPGGEIRYADPEFDYTVVVSSPSDRPDLWERFITGALGSYRRFGVESALALDDLRVGTTTSLFLAAVDESDEILAGVRARGPFLAATDAYADMEMASNAASQAALRAMITERLPFGVLESKTGWVSDSARQYRGLTKIFGQGPAIAAALSGSRFTFGTAAKHVIGHYLSSGAVVADHIEPVEYPDSRFKTKAIYWDHGKLKERADSDQYRRMGNAVDAVLHGTGPFAVNRRSATG
ncbi:hypothetical protein GCM10007304_39250 [Rhodococcoides trifolii]|uniref:Uncharacterized protein n=1 Tax=Rhodococcoides trifolii TaxID=908250 RepID=A0A917LG99_9NOCA|nr:hypothetical protein [Rhodococcus trifolii]GGG21596.1 hypothetical protein GCM10007304_39250 [Rhodococcus trifolii]